MGTTFATVLEQYFEFVRVHAPGVESQPLSEHVVRAQLASKRRCSEAAVIVDRGEIPNDAIASERKSQRCSNDDRAGREVGNGHRDAPQLHGRVAGSVCAFIPANIHDPALSMAPTTRSTRVCDRCEFGVIRNVVRTCRPTADVPC